MKKTKRLAAIVAAMAMAAAFAVPGYVMTASATDVSINVSSDKASHTYSAYPIFTGANTTAGLTITGWGTGYNSAGLLADTSFTDLVITPATGTDPAVTVGSFIGSKTDAATVAQAIEALQIASDSKKADELAAILKKYIGTTATEVSKSAETPTNLGAGYWIVLDSYSPSADAPANANPDAVSKFILRVSGGTEPISIVPKKSYPTVVKKVKENTDVSDYTYTAGGSSVTDADYNDVADYCIGDAVPFKLYGTLPSNYADYAHYYYKFTDTLASSFTAPTAGNVTVKVNGTAISNPAGETNMRISVSGSVITVSFEDIKAFAPNATDVVTVEYAAVLNSNAVIGLDGQENKVDLTYSNNPNITYNPDTTDTDEDVPTDDNGTPDTSDDTPSTDTTPEDKVIVFTYQQNIKKVDSATGTPLSAVFTLSRTNGGTTEYAQVSSGKITGWTTTVADASELTTDATTGMCSVSGLDDGAYTITEKTPPTGYNSISPATLTIAATTANGQAWDGDPDHALTAITLTVGGDTHVSNDSASLTAAEIATNGIVQAKITNDKGINLPTTGGIGTTLFIVIGGVCAAAAGIYLVSKKRAKEEIGE